MPRRETKYLVIHCSATRPNMDVGAKEIRSWHLQKGWSDIGYHYVIRRDGRLESGRPENAIGSHVAGHNANTLGICMVGGVSDAKGWPAENNFTPAQWGALKALLARMLKKYPGATVLGHRDFPKVAKACPSFDARAWAKDNGFPAAPALRGGGVTYGFGSIIGGGVSDQVISAGDAINANADKITNALDLAQGKIETVASVFTYAGYAVAAISAVAGAFALYRFTVMAHRWWRGENDFGSRTPDDNMEMEHS